MTIRTPTYLTIRNGVYYFQTRIPADFVHDRGGKYKLIRRSTRTGNRREALKIARTWWVELMTDKEIKTWKEAEEESRHEDELYMDGAVLHAALDKIHPRDNDVANAVAESFFHTLKTELTHHHNFKDRKEAEHMCVLMC